MSVHPSHRLPTEIWRKTFELASQAPHHSTPDPFIPPSNAFNDTSPKGQLSDVPYSKRIQTRKAIARVCKSWHASTAQEQIMSEVRIDEDCCATVEKLANHLERSKAEQQVARWGNTSSYARGDYGVGWWMRRLEIHVHEADYSDVEQNLLRVFSCAPNLEVFVLDVISFHHSNDLLQQLFARCPKLRWLHLEDCTEENLETIVQLGGSLTTLSLGYLTGTTSTRSREEKVSEEVSADGTVTRHALPSVCTLQISDPRLLTHATTQWTLPSLRHMSCHLRTFNSREADNVVAFFKTHGSQLRTLDIRNADWQSIAPLCPNLTHVVLEAYSLSRDKFSPVSSEPPAERGPLISKATDSRRLSKVKYVAFHGFKRLAGCDKSDDQLTETIEAWLFGVKRLDIPALPALEMMTNLDEVVERTKTRELASAHGRCDPWTALSRQALQHGILT